MAYLRGLVVVYHISPIFTTEKVSKVKIIYEVKNVQMCCVEECVVKNVLKSSHWLICFVRNYTCISSFCTLIVSTIEKSPTFLFS